MMRLILLTFGFMGWSWYELSGGSEFEPGENGLRVLAKVEAEALPEAKPVVAAVSEPKPVVTRAKTGVTELASVSAASFPETSKVVTVVPHPGRVKTVEEPVRLASLETLVKGETLVNSETVTAAPEVKIDYRIVTGNRVNLRAGPGTSYGVVTKLLRGDDVEVLQDDGTGWVKLRSFDGNQIGWMSESFLEVASN